MVWPQVSIKKCMLKHCRLYIIIHWPLLAGLSVLLPVSLPFTAKTGLFFQLQPCTELQHHKTGVCKSDIT